MQQHKRISGILIFSEKKQVPEDTIWCDVLYTKEYLFSHSFIHMIKLFKKAQKWKHHGQDSSYL